LIGRFAIDSPSHPSEQNRLAGDPGFGGSFDYAPGNAYPAGELCGGASLRMTDLFFILDLPERKPISTHLETGKSYSRPGSQ
jgi:hypothetical protein